jgi:hypothetical protein
MLSPSLLEAILAFRQERDWEQFHTPRNLSAAICVEAAELLDHFRWTRDSDTPASRTSSAPHWNTKSQISPSCCPTSATTWESTSRLGDSRRWHKKLEIKARLRPYLLGSITAGVWTCGSTPYKSINETNPEQRHGSCGGSSSTATPGGRSVRPGHFVGITTGLIQATETTEEAQLLCEWFDLQWSGLVDDPGVKDALVGELQALANHRAPFLIYTLILHHLFRDRGEDLDEERIIKAATGIRNTVVWKKLYRFQRDGVIGAIDKLERFGGCIIADSVGLGKTFEALAIIKYHELRNDRVLVLCPKRLRDNWTLYKANDRRNFLAPDRSIMMC